MSKKLEEYTKEELIEVIKDLKRRKRFGLVWEDKPEEVAKLVRTELPVLEEVTKLAIDKVKDAPTNFIIEGDNYHALSVLNYTHAGKIDVIYIDPPYNTGKKDFKYNDRYVDKEDTFRHSKWLSFMSKRLELAKTLLNYEGIIFISIDDNEYAQLKLLCDHVFSESRFLGSIIWEKRTKSQNTKTAKRMLQPKTEYILVYKNNNERHEFNLITSGNRDYPEQDERGLFRYKKIEEMSASGMRGRTTMVFPILGVSPRDGFQWKFGQDQIKFFASRNDLVLRKKRPYIKIRPEDEDKDSYNPFWSLFLSKDVGTAETGKAELKKIFDGDDKGFETVKPINLLKKLVFHASKPSSIILDFFAGTGTTGHAVLELNKEDGGRRQFILCTDNENNIAEQITYPRVSRVIEGYADHGGIASNLRYFKTSIVNRKQTDDQTRTELVARSTDMICLREDTFEKILDSGLFKVFCGCDHYTAIVFDPDVIELLKDALTKFQDNKPVHIYVFSLSNDTYESDFVDLERPHELRPIPESILEVYRRIFSSQNGVMGAYD
jgi:adenine-specific DNA-methyltransferase